jgi:hypothetical protein
VEEEENQVVQNQKMRKVASKTDRAVVMKENRSNSRPLAVANRKIMERKKNGDISYSICDNL